MDRFCRMIFAAFPAPKGASRDNTLTVEFWARNRTKGGFFLKKISAALVVCMITHPVWAVEPEQVPEHYVGLCKSKAASHGFGRCEVEKGKENAYGAYHLKLICVAGVASCVGRVKMVVNEWSGMSEYLYNE